jgi:hypothetical protein
MKKKINDIDELVEYNNEHNICDEKNLDYILFYLNKINSPIIFFLTEDSFEIKLEAENKMNIHFDLWKNLVDFCIGNNYPHCTDDFVVKSKKQKKVLQDILEKIFQSDIKEVIYLKNDKIVDSDIIMIFEDKVVKKFNGHFFFRSKYDEKKEYKYLPWVL